MNTFDWFQVLSIFFKGTWFLESDTSRPTSGSAQPQEKEQQEHIPCIIEGVGEVRTRWIGQKGV